jgi:hypothetical protein
MMDDVSPSRPWRILRVVPLAEPEPVVNGNPESVSYSRQLYVEGVNILTAGVFKQQKRVARPDAHPIAASVSCLAKVRQTGDLFQTVIAEAQPEDGPRRSNSLILSRARETSWTLPASI